MSRIRREEVAFPSSPDPRFGGNMARATEGAQYRGSPRDYYGGPSKGSPMHDDRYGNYVAPHRVDYTRNAPPQSSGTPNFRPPYGAPGQPSYNEWLQQIDPFHTGPYPPKKHPNPRMRGMGGGLESLESKINLQEMFERFPGMNLWKLIQQLDKRGIEYAGNDTGIGSTDEYQMAKVYTNQDPGMVNRNKFWFDSLTPESEAINKVLDMPAMEEMRQGSEKDWNYKDFREKVPQYLWDQLPDEAFETLSDFRNQQRITT